MTLVMSSLYLRNRKGVGNIYLVGTMVRGCRCAMSWYDLDLTFDFAVLTLTCKILSGLIYQKPLRCRKLVLSGDIGWGCRYAMSWYDIDLTFKLLSRVHLGIRKV